MWNSYWSTAGREMCMGIVSGQQPPDYWSDICVLQVKSSMYVQHRKFENTENCMETA